MQVMRQVLGGLRRLGLAWRCCEGCLMRHLQGGFWRLGSRGFHAGGGLRL